MGQVRPARTAPRASTSCSLLSRPSLATGVLLTTVDPILVTEFSVVFSAVALPLTYFPILVVANDPDYMGEHVNGRLANALGIGLPRASSGWPRVAAIPLMIVTRMGA